MDLKYSKAMNEVMQVVNFLNNEDKKRIPENVISFFEKNQTLSENIIKPNVPLVDQNISLEGKALLTYINKYL